jgi:hypothetical protein
MKQRRIRAVVKVTARKLNARRAEKQKCDPAESATYKEFLEQAEVCREQAHDAVRLKRFKAACGLFSTAIALCNRAVTMSGDACVEAKEALRQMQTEMAIYSELARSMERPIMAPMLRTELGESLEPRTLT